MLRHVPAFAKLFALDCKTVLVAIAVVAVAPHRDHVVPNVTAQLQEGGTGSLVFVGSSLAMSCPAHSYIGMHTSKYLKVGAMHMLEASGLRLQDHGFEL